MNVFYDKSINTNIYKTLYIHTAKEKHSAFAVGQKKS